MPTPIDPTGNNQQGQTSGQQGSTQGASAGGGSFTDFKKQEDKKKPFDPSTPITGTLGISEEEILSGDKNIFGRPIAGSGGGKPQDAKGQFEAVINAVIPPHTLKLDEMKFKELLAGSISLLFDEKMEIVRMIPQLKQEQVDQLLNILEDERKKFQELAEKHKVDMIKSKEEKMIESKQKEEQFLSQEKSKKGEDVQAAEDLLKGLE